MEEKTLFSIFARALFGERLSAGQKVLTQYEEVFFSLVLLAALVICVFLVYPWYVVVGVCLSYCAYACVVNLASLALRRAAKPQSIQLIRALLAWLFISVGLTALVEIRESLWLLFIFPLWRVIRYDPKSPVGTLIAYCLTVGSLLVIARHSHPNLEEGLQWAVTKVVWLGFLVLIVLGYVSLVRRYQEAANRRLASLNKISRDMFQTQALPKWCEVVLVQVLELTRATYATFQICNYRTGEIILQAALERKDDEYKSVPVPTFPVRIMFLPMDAASITASVARTGEVRVVPDVREEKNYVIAFERTMTEMAVPIWDFANDRVGGVLNVEYDEKDRPKSSTQLAVDEFTLAEIVQQIGASFSYVALADERNALQRIVDHCTTKESELEIASELVVGLFRQCRCSGAVWLRGSGKDSERLRLSVSRGLPRDYALSKPSIPLRDSILGKTLLEWDSPQVVSTPDRSNVDHWDRLLEMERRPRTVLLMPLAVGEQKLGVTCMYLPVKYNFATQELDLFQKLAQQIALLLWNLKSREAEKAAITTEFVLAAAHDVGAQLAIFTELAQRISDELAESGSRHLATMLSEEIHLLRETTDLLVSHVRSYKMPTRHYELEPLLEYAITSLIRRKELDPGQVAMPSIPEDARVVRCNRPAVIRAFRNILRNAVQAMGSRQRPITVTIDAGPRLVNIRFRNLGPPIPEDVRKRLFEERFVSEGKQHGFGLGTYRRLIVAMGGTLDLLETNRLRGTQFRVQLVKGG